MEIGIIGTRRYVDLTNLTLDGQRLPAVYVNSRIIYKSDESSFQGIIRDLESRDKPGFFLTNQKGDFYVRIRWMLNRHCVLSSDLFYDSKRNLYRDIDAKGVGYTRGFPMKFLSVRLPEMEGDIELRGILHDDVAIEDREITEELEELGIRVARHVAQIELYDLVNQEGEVVPRNYFSEEIGVNLDMVRPTVAIRAMGTTSRIWDLRVNNNTHNQNYIREIVDDAVSLVSAELGYELSPEEYVEWFVDTMGRQLGVIHRNKMMTDFTGQIHGGQHNLTLDCRLTDTYHYQTPKKLRRIYERLLREAEGQPALKGLLDDMFPSNKTEEEVRENNRRCDKIDREGHERVVKAFTDSVGEIYPLGSLKDDVVDRFGKAYESEKGH